MKNKRQQDIACGIIPCKYCEFYYECIGYEFKKLVEKIPQSVEEIRKE